MKKILLLFLSFVTCILSAQTSTDVSVMPNVLYSEESTVMLGATLQLPIYMKNSNNVTLFQCDIYLPEGLSFAKKESGKYDVTLDKTRLTQADDDHVISASLQKDGALRILCASQSNLLFDGDDGQVATVTVNVAPDAIGGKHLIQINRQKLVSPSNTGVSVPEYQVVVTVVDPATINCDLNCDGKVDIADVTFLVNRIVEMQNESE